MKICVVVASLLISETLFSTPLKSRQVRFFYHAFNNQLPEFAKMLPKARMKTVEQSLIYAATGDAIDVVEHLVGEQTKFTFSKFHLRRTLELASEFGSANVVFYLLDLLPWEHEELERAERWARTSEHPLTHSIIVNKLVEINQATQTQPLEAVPF